MKWIFLQNLFGKAKLQDSDSEQHYHELDEPTFDTKVLLERAKDLLRNKVYTFGLII